MQSKFQISTLIVQISTFTIHCTIPVPNLYINSSHTITFRKLIVDAQSQKFTVMLQSLKV